jgi:hypothetical protein
MTNTFEENFFKQLLDSNSIDEEREVFSLLADCMANMGKERFKLMLIKASALSKKLDGISGD